MSKQNRTVGGSDAVSLSICTNCGERPADGIEGECVECSVRWIEHEARVEAWTAQATAIAEEIKAIVGGSEWIGWIFEDAERRATGEEA